MSKTTASELRGFADRYMTELTALADRAGGERKFVVETLSDVLAQRLERLQPRASEQPSLPWPGVETRCPKCLGSGNVYYLHATVRGADIVGGKRVRCPVCDGTGSVRVPSQLQHPD